MAPGHSHLEDKNMRKILVVNEQTNLVLRSSLMIHMKAFDSRHHLAELKAMLRRELKVWSSDLCLEGNRISAGGSGSLSDNSSRDAVANETRAAFRTDKSALEQRDKKYSLNNNGPEVEIGRCCVVLWSSLRPLVGKVHQILRQFKINLLDMDAALPEEALRPSRPDFEKKLAWRTFVKFAETIFEMVQATIMLEDMIKIEYLMNGWWYWSSLSAAAKTSIVSSLALCIYSLDAAIAYEKISFNLDDWQSLAQPATTIHPTQQMPHAEQPVPPQVSHPSEPTCGQPYGYPSSGQVQD